MKKLLLITATICLTLSVAEAAKGDSTKAQFMATQKAQHEKKGWTWNQEKMDKMFSAMDANGDGIVSGAEKKTYWADPAAAEAAAAEKAAGAPAAAPASAAAKKKLKKGDSTLEMFLATQKAQKEKKGIEFNENMHKKMFEQMDTDGDGIVTGAEKKAYWSK